MLSMEDLKSLEPGDTIEAGSLLDGMTQESLKLSVLVCGHLTPADPLQLVLEGRYFGVVVGKWSVIEKDGKPVWTELMHFTGGKEAAA